MNDTTTWPKATTVDGVEIVPGLRVWDNNLDVGVVTDRDPHMERNYNAANGPVYPAPGSTTPWFTVRRDRDGATEALDGGRMVTVWNGKAA